MLNVSLDGDEGMKPKYEPTKKKGALGSPSWRDGGGEGEEATEEMMGVVGTHGGRGTEMILFTTPPKFCLNLKMISCHW